MLRNGRRRDDEPIVGKNGTKQGGGKPGSVPALPVSTEGTSEILESNQLSVEPRVKMAEKTIADSFESENHQKPAATSNQQSKAPGVNRIHRKTRKPRTMRRSLMNIFGLLLLLGGTLTAGWELLGHDEVEASYESRPTLLAAKNELDTSHRKKIEDIQIGDRVLARDEFGEEIGWQPVRRLFRNTVDHLRFVKLRSPDGPTQTIEATDEHPFWSTDRNNWIAAVDLKLGEQLTGPDGQPLAVVWNTREDHPEGVAVYNFEVTNAHTYYVSAPGDPRGPPVLAHNACGVGGKVEQPRDVYGRFRAKKSVGDAIPGSPNVDDFVENARRNGYDVFGTEISVRTPFGLRRYDAVIRNRQTGSVLGVEIKSSRAALTRFDKAARQQKAADIWVRMNGGLQAVGKGIDIMIDDVISLYWKLP
ncbi:hypothetical protein V22_19400 [Calycomorphotria hydatis]|uniref:Intein C-terminal splicing domain-containing protein n=2 Tax=Calycomorphotria hydatis TaxID=2528027 RepID=A0A517T8M1_9PLAN|nr:hypothetical protein V22_19400 [Calycomorphotria hydatis]